MELAEVGTRMSCPEFVTLPDARFTTGAAMPRLSVQLILKPLLVVVLDPAATNESLLFIVPMIVLY